MLEKNKARVASITRHTPDQQITYGTTYKHLCVRHTTYFQNRHSDLFCALPPKHPAAWIAFARARLGVRGTLAFASSSMAQQQCDRSTQRKLVGGQSQFKISPSHLARGYQQAAPKRSPIEGAAFSQTGQLRRPHVASFADPLRRHLAWLGAVVWQRL